MINQTDINPPSPPAHTHERGGAQILAKKALARKGEEGKKEGEEGGRAGGRGEKEGRRIFPLSPAQQWCAPMQSHRRASLVGCTSQREGTQAATQGQSARRSPTLRRARPPRAAKIVHL